MKIDLERLNKLRAEHPTWGTRKLAAALGSNRDAVRQGIEQLKAIGKPKAPEEIVDRLRAVIAKQPTAPGTLCRLLGVDDKTVAEAIELLAKTHTLQWQGQFLAIAKPAFGHLPLKFLDGGKWITIGLVADTHLACREERLDALHSHYDLMEREGVEHVLHAGNIVDGYIPKINGGSVHCTGVDDQCLYVVDNYPARKGMVTHFITGDDHESWLMKDGLNFGWYLQKLAEHNGRTDLHYIGHVESDVDVATPQGTVRIKVQHPGGGSAYARSYTGQKQVEALQGGEKPQILVQGHYHVSNYMVDRNVHVIGLPGFQDQTIFARKKRLRMEVGGAILSFKVTEAGSVGRVRLEFNLFFDRGFYRPFLRSDKRLLKGHLTLTK